MTTTEVAYKLREEPCQASLSFCYNKTIQEAWEQCTRPDWMLYAIEKFFSQSTLIRVKYEMVKPYFQQNPYLAQMIQRYLDETLSLQSLIDSANLLEGSDHNVYRSVVTQEMTLPATVSHYLIWSNRQFGLTSESVADQMNQMANTIREQIPYFLLLQQIKNKS